MKIDDLCKLLMDKGMTIATAESCTGGMLGAALTSVPGISDCYGYGVVTYSNEAKEKLLGVNHNTLAEHGAVSPETALEMACGALNISEADIAVSITGIAGPGGGTQEKPVGLVYVGIARKDQKNSVHKLMLKGNRQEVRSQVIDNVIRLIIDSIKNK
ncbi:MAG: nicotinamide-nucleotide amidohydrolase family protein [Clostridia bacterium]|nr:nicotinamide-nucleotide amidohydrolase family protein [Clostridia bacterium]